MTVSVRAYLKRGCTKKKGYYFSKKCQDVKVTNGGGGAIQPI
jgi:hypothetical protein